MKGVDPMSCCIPYCWFLRLSTLLLLISGFGMRSKQKLTQSKASHSATNFKTLYHHINTFSALVARAVPIVFFRNKQTNKKAFWLNKVITFLSTLKIRVVLSNIFCKISFYIWTQHISEKYFGFPINVRKQETHYKFKTYIIYTK